MNVLWTYVSPTRQGGPAVLKGRAGQDAADASPERVVRLFCLWKLILLFVACASPGLGYDTSAWVAFDQRLSSTPSPWLDKLVAPVLLRLTRWDAIYFTSISERGHVYEQEWAFGGLFSQATSVVARVLFWPFRLTSMLKHALAGVLVSTISHFLAVLALYWLVHSLVPTAPAKKRRLAFVTACLHVISPAGIFLQAPFGESTFALCNLMGMWSYVLAAQSRFSSARRGQSLETYYTIGAGLWFAAATTTRSNGLLSGLIFVWDVLVILPRLWQLMGSKKTREREERARLAARLVGIVAAGTLIAIAFAVPQTLAYLDYCTGGNSRPWCSRFPPSIYSFVQDRYWDVGFLRYWKISNLPLFALAFPMGWIMVETSLPTLFQSHHINRVVNGSTAVDKDYQPYPPTPATTEERVFQHCLKRFALPQLVLVTLAATSFHCQIINRLSSGYPIWYLVIAIEMVEGRLDGGGRPTQGLFRMLGNHDRLPWAKPKWVVRGMVLYAMVQAALYGSFLPPA